MKFHIFHDISHILKGHWRSPLYLGLLDIIEILSYFILVDIFVILVQCKHIQGVSKKGFSLE